MRWTPSSLITGVQSLFNGLSGTSDDRSQSALDDVRQAMLDGLDESSAVGSHSVRMRVTYARDLQDLWYLRGDLMAVLAAMDGEVAARQKLLYISNMFKGHLPRGLSSRPSPLGD
jgi:hypothetical protein